MGLNQAQFKKVVRKNKLLIRRFMAGIVIVGICWLAYIMIGRLLCYVAVKSIAELTGAQVHIESVEWKPDGLVKIIDFSLSTDDAQQGKSSILKAKTINARFGFGSLLLLKPKLKTLTIDDFVLNIQYDSDAKRWNFSHLETKKPARPRQRLPVFRFKNGIARYTTISIGRVDDILTFPVSGTFNTIDSDRDSYAFYLETQNEFGIERSRVEGKWQGGNPGRITLNGQGLSAKVGIFGNASNITAIKAGLEYDANDIVLTEFVAKLGNKTVVNLDGRIKNYITLPEFQIHANIENLFVTSSPVANSFVYNETSLRNFGPFLQRFFNQYSPEGLIDLDIKAQGRFDELPKATCTGKVICKDASVRYVRFPYLLEHIQGTLDLTEKGVILNNLQCKHADVKLAIDGYSKNFGPEWDCEIQITSSNMLLDNDLYEALTTKQKRLWFAFAPTGRAKINYRFIRSPDQKKKRTLDIHPVNAQVVYEHFPYPLRNLTGQVHVDNGIIQLLNLVSDYDNRKIILNGRIINIDSEVPEFDISIDADNIPVDSELMSALPSKQRQFYDYLDIDAFADAKIQVFSNKAGTQTAEYIANIKLTGTSFLYDKLPLKLSDISADVIVRPDLIQIENMTGRNRDGFVSVKGRVWPENGSDEIVGYQLLLKGEGLDVDDELIRSLPSGPARLLSQLDIEGKVNISAQLEKNSKDKPREYEVVVDCLDNSINFKKFYYPLKHINGRVVITKDCIGLENLTAMGDEEINLDDAVSMLKTSGKIWLDNGDFNEAEFSIHATDFNFDEKLHFILPKIIQDSYQKIWPTGRFDLNIKSLKIFDDDQDKRWVDFEGGVRFKNCAFGKERLIDQLTGSVTAKALYEFGAGMGQAQVVLKAESLNVKHRQLSDLEGSVHYEPDKDVLAVRQFVGNCYGGKFTGSLELKEDPEDGPTYALQLSFSDIDLQQFVSASKPNENYSNICSSGKMGGVFSLAGKLSDRSSRTGRLKINISDMQAGKSSLMGKVLAVLKMNKPTDYVFNNMLIDAYIKHNNLVFKQIDIRGRSVALRGLGSMDLKSKNVDLTFTATAPNLDNKSSLWESLAEGFGPAVARIEVTGRFDEPKIEKTTLPIFKDSINVLGTKPSKPESEL